MHSAGPAPSPLAGEGVVPQGRRGRMLRIRLGMRGAPQGALAETTSDAFEYGRSLRERRANFSDGEFGRANHQIVRQAEDMKTLRLKPCVAGGVAGHAPIVTRPIDFDNEPMLEANEVNNVICEDDLALKFRTLTAPVTHRLPDHRLSGEGLSTLIPRKRAHDSSRYVFGHWLYARLAAPPSWVTLRVTPSPARGEGVHTVAVSRTPKTHD